MRVRQSEDRRKINCSDDQGSVEISQLEERRGDECESDGDEIDEDEDGWLRRGEGRKTEEDSQGIARCQKKSREGRWMSRNEWQLCSYEPIEWLRENISPEVEGEMPGG
jgi:hypothetical protein